MKSLAKDTAIYGLSSIIGRFLNYLLVPLYTYKIAASSGGYGVITNLYAYTALLLVILTYGMETTFFRFANKEGEDPKLVYSSILRMVGLTSLVFIGLVFAFIGPISSAMGYPEDDIEKTVRNLGAIGSVGMQATDRMILDIMLCK